MPGIIRFFQYPNFLVYILSRKLLIELLKEQVHLLKVLNVLKVKSVENSAVLVQSSSNVNKKIRILEKPAWNLSLESFDGILDTSSYLRETGIHGSGCVKTENNFNHSIRCSIFLALFLRNIINCFSCFPFCCFVILRINIF